jgi:hypothetical protein
MPLGFERLNERTHRPNENINFIKPLATSSEQDQKIAKDFLERIAAQCYPIMKKEYISVMSLEEFPPNTEFLGRNFNAGECIQLVLKDKAGRWLSVKFVQMVMMHELAHCKQMNHSRYFWQVRNKLAESMQDLWSKKYTGEGVWGRGQDLESGVFVHDRMPDSADIPEHLCGGMYRRKSRKRKRGQDEADKPKMTYAERQQKRIAKKFGKHGDGHDLGEDELVRGALEQGKRRYGKPRVANSKRGRELRANAALARLEAAKHQQQTADPQGDDDSETESGSESDDEYGDSLPILEKLGEITDQDGHHFFKIDEDVEDDGGACAQDELRELQLLASDDPKNTRKDKGGTSTLSGGDKNGMKRLYEDSETDSEPDENDVSTRQPKCSNVENTNAPPTKALAPPSTLAQNTEADQGSGTGVSDASGQDQDSQPATPPTGCPVCTMENNPDSPTCVACGNVLKPIVVRNHWRCKSEQCKGSKYINVGDAGVCALCGARKPAVQGPIGVTTADTLRWD